MIEIGFVYISHSEKGKRGMEKSADESRRMLTRVLRQQLESLQRSGVTQLRKVAPQSAAASVSEVGASAATSGAPRPARPESSAAVRPEREPATQLAASVPAWKPVSPTMAAGSVPGNDTGAEATTWGRLLDREARCAAFEAMQREVAACTLCRELAETRTQTVFGVGNIQPRVCFFGEAPGADEDRQGEPFVGRAGQLLDKIIEASQMKRDEVYILNTLKCRPPGNRTPAAEEIARCRHFFERQLAILQPEFIVCLGTVAAQSLLRTTESTGRLRGRFHAYQGSKVLVTYHPAYLLRNPNAKKEVWQDMKMLMREMGLTPPGE